MLRMVLQKMVVDRGGTGDAAEPAGLRWPKTEQTYDVAGIRVERLALGRLVDPSTGLFLYPQVGHVTEQMTFSVLRDRIAQPGPDTPIGACHAVARQPLDGQAADQGEAATVQQFVQQILQNHAESG